MEGDIQSGQQLVGVSQCQVRTECLIAVGIPSGRLPHQPVPVHCGYLHC